MTGRDPFELLGLPRTASILQVHAARRRLAKRLHPDLGGDSAAMQEVNAAASAALRLLGVRAPSAAHEPRRFADDRPSFVVEALPAETFEALLIVSSWIGEVISDDPPYGLEVELTEPVRCWCRLELFPEAGASSVGLSAGTLDDGPEPPLEAIRDLWIRCLNQLDWDDLDRRIPGSPSPPPLS